MNPFPIKEKSDIIQENYGVVTANKMNKMNGSDRQKRKPPANGQSAQRRDAWERSAFDEHYEEMLDDRMRAKMAQDDRMYHSDGRADAINRGKYADLSAFQSQGHRRIRAEVMRKRKRAQMIRKAVPICALALAGGIALSIWVAVLGPAGRYKQACADFEASNYISAHKSFAALGSYKDSASYTAYIDALFASDAGRYDEAADGFSALGDFLDSPLRAQTARSRQNGNTEQENAYQRASELYAQGDFAAAQTAFAALGDYKDSAQMAVTAGKQATYAAAEQALAGGNTARAKELFASLGDYRDAADRVASLEAGARQDALEQSYQDALKLFEWDDFAGAQTGLCRSRQLSGKRPIRKLCRSDGKTAGGGIQCGIAGLFRLRELP